MALSKSQEATAAADLENWNTERDMRLQKKKENNRSEESVVIDTLAADASDKAAWGRVLKMVAASETPVAGKSDTQRMHSLFIQLKNEPVQ